MGSRRNPTLAYRPNLRYLQITLIKPSLIHAYQKRPRREERDEESPNKRFRVVGISKAQPERETELDLSWLTEPSDDEEYLGRQSRKPIMVLY